MFTTEEAAIIYKLFEDQRICPLQKDSDKYCAAVLSIIKKLYDATNVSGAGDAAAAVSTELEGADDKTTGLEAGTAEGRRGKNNNRRKRNA